MTQLYDFTVQNPDGTPHPMSAHRGQVLLIVNTASKCGFTPQYAALEALQREHAAQGFTVLGFPCNQFGHQEPGDAAEIANFCSLTYDTTFPLLAKIEVNGPNASPLYKFLKTRKSGLFGLSGIKWNFTKFLIGRNGEVLGRYAPTQKPEKLAPVIEQALAAAA